MFNKTIILSALTCLLLGVIITLITELGAVLYIQNNYGWRTFKISPVGVKWSLE